jgi:hypothetical protein
MCALWSAAILNLDNSVVDLETLQALYENVRNIFTVLLLISFHIALLTKCIFEL